MLLGSVAPELGMPRTDSLLTKIVPQRGLQNKNDVNRLGLSRKEIMFEVEESLKRLGTECVFEAESRF